MSKVWIVIIIALILSFNFWVYSYYNYTPRQEDYARFDDEVYISCEKINDEVVCYLPNGENLTIKRDWDITLT